MTTVQIVGIAVAAIVVLLLVVALLVTRRRSENEDAGPTSPAEQGSFLDAPVHDTLSGLGKAEHEPSEATPLPGSEPAPPVDTPQPGAGPATAGLGLGLDWGPGGGPGGTETTGEVPALDRDDTEITGEIQLPAEAAGTPAAPPAGGQEAGEPGAATRLVPLRDIIVTTSDKLVDLGDPEVRRMLTDLVTFEIDQATQYRQQGQTIDAVLQLTEAEKISEALGMQETAERISQMMADLNA